MTKFLTRRPYWRLSIPERLQAILWRKTNKGESMFPWQQTVSSERRPSAGMGLAFKDPPRATHQALPFSQPSKQHHRLGRKHSKNKSVGNLSHQDRRAGYVGFPITLVRVTYQCHRLQFTYVIWRATDSKLCCFMSLLISVLCFISRRVIYLSISTVSSEVTNSRISSSNGF